MAGYDGIRLSQMLSPKLTTVKQDTATIGRKASEELIRAIEKPKTALVKRISVQAQVIKGESVRKL